MPITIFNIIVSNRRNAKSIEKVDVPPTLHQMIN
jgi:hypothetical protein